MGWLANILIVIGGLCLGHKWRHAFLLSMAGETIWAGRALWTEQYDLTAICVVAVCVAGRNWWLWGNA